MGSHRGWVLSSPRFPLRSASQNIPVNFWMTAKPGSISKDSLSGIITSTTISPSNTSLRNKPTLDYVAKSCTEHDLGNRWHFLLDNRWGRAFGAVGLGNYSDFVCGIDA